MTKRLSGRGRAGAPEGNDNAGQGRRWREALNRALARSGGTVDKGLDECADQLVKAAKSGQWWALEHLADRLDGKPAQTVHSHIVTEKRLSYAERLAAEAATAADSLAATPERQLQ